MKQATESFGPRHTCAWALIRDGEHAGSIIWAYPKDGAGIVRCDVRAWSGNLAALLPRTSATGSAGGYGYDKGSAAFADALSRAKVAVSPHGYQRDGVSVGCKPVHGGAGMSEVRRMLRSIGYAVVEVL